MPPDIVLLTSKPDRTFEGLWKDKQQPTEIINFNAQAPRNVVKQITWSNLKKNVVKLISIMNFLPEHLWDSN